MTQFTHAEIQSNELTRPNLHQLGQSRGRGNLLGIEPYMVPQDYASLESFFNKLDSYLQIAQREQWLDDKTIVLFPEYIGTWLVFANESEKIFQTSTLNAAERAMVLRHLLKFSSYFLKSTEKGKVEAAFFRIKARQMASIYHAVFSQLAQDYAITLIAGSIVLPAPRILNGELMPNEGPLRNVSVVYQLDGAPYSDLICKAFPTSAELNFTAPDSAKNLPSFETPAGRLGVMICADSWFPQAYTTMKEQDIDLLAVPSFDILGSEYWNRRWQGYDGWPAPADVDGHDIKRITEAQAWKKYSLAGRIPSSGAKSGMNIFLRGKLWDQDLGGKPATLVLVRENEVFVEEPTQQAAILNLWL
jgi:predicted amidohydrolase